MPCRSEPAGVDGPRDEAPPPAHHSDVEASFRNPAEAGRFVKSPSPAPGSYPPK